jgi:hypothetical protein
VCNAYWHISFSDKLWSTEKKPTKLLPTFYNYNILLPRSRVPLPLLTFGSRQTAKNITQLTCNCIFNHLILQATANPSPSSTDRGCKTTENRAERRTDKNLKEIGSPPPYNYIMAPSFTDEGCATTATQRRPAEVKVNTEVKIEVKTEACSCSCANV